MGKLYYIGNAHLDPVWLWRWQEGFTEILATFRSALDRMNDFDDFKFTCACGAYYQWVEKMDPSMFEEIRQRVKEGRWSIVGGWIIQPDCNTPSGESFSRQSLLGQRYFEAKFGVTAKTGYNVDSFGHNASLPQILKKSGMDNYVFMRPAPHEDPSLDDIFIWESKDGSQVKAHRIIGDYGTREIKEIEKIKTKANNDNRDYMALYGVGNHGGGPTIALIDGIKKLGYKDDIFSVPDEYFANMNEDGLMVHKGELQHHGRGCYSAQSDVKLSNRKAENNLIAAEKYALMAQKVAGVPYPKDELNKAWHNVLFNQFHDIMGGCSIREAYRDASYLYGETMKITDHIIFESMCHIKKNIDTLQGETLQSYKIRIPGRFSTWEHQVADTPVVVFNPHPYPVKQMVEYNVIKTTKMTDEEGVEIPFQFVRGPQTNCDGDKYVTAFIANVPAYGYRTYRLSCEKPSEVTFENPFNVTENSLENSKIRLSFDKASGEICEYYLKDEDRYIIQRPCSAILLDETKCDTWAHGPWDYEKNIGYEIIELGDKVAEFSKPEFKIIDNGPVRASIMVTQKYGNSIIKREYRIFPDCDTVDVKTYVDFREKHRTLKFAFPTGGDKITSAIPYGTIDRKLKTGEEPCGRYIASGSLCIANEGQHGYDSTENEVRLTVLRSAIYADHYSHRERDELCEFMEQGEHFFTYKLCPFTTINRAERDADTLNTPLIAHLESFHKGSLPQVMSFAGGTSKNISVTAIKQAEDGDGIIVRFVETEGKDGRYTFSLFGKEYCGEIGHNEIKTLKVDDKVKEVNLIEW